MKSWSWSPVLLIIATAVVLGCNGGDETTEPDEVSVDPPPATVPECEKNWNFARYDQVQSLVNWVQEERDTAAFLSGPRESQNTAEYHDCQRFVLGSDIDQAEGFSDGIFSIFAVPKADSIQAHVSDAVYGDSAALGLALPAAQIFAPVAQASAGDTAYGPLGIREGFNCLYLHPTGDGNWAAHLRYDGWDEEICSEAIPISAIGTPPEIWHPLSVDRSTSEGPDAMGYPVVARWIWHYNERARFQEYKMGVWCDLGWCEVGGPATHAATPSFAAAKGVPSDIANTKRLRVNAWFDEQILAGFNGSLFVSGIVGTVIPARGLGEFDEDTFREGRWVRTARVALTPLQAHTNPANPFEQKLNLGMSQNHAVGLNQVFLCRGPWQAASGAPVCEENGITEPDGLDAQQIHRDDFQWWGKIVRRGGGPPVTKYFSVARCPYDFDVAGTARWRWLSDDPGIWMRCINGCCELDGKH